MDKEIKEALFQFKRSIAIHYEMETTSMENERNIIILKYIDDLQQRIDKAVEYIENDLQISILPNNQIINGKEVIKRINKIINILKGDDTKAGE